MTKCKKDYEKTEAFTGVSILLPAINETHSFYETWKIIYDTCDHGDLAEFFIIFGKITTEETRKIGQQIQAECKDVPVVIYEQQKPFIGNAIRESFPLVTGSHVVMMSTDLETDPHIIREFIRLSKENPNDIITASRWIKGGGFVGYNKIKLICNYIFQKLISLCFLSRNTDLTYAYRIFPVKLMRAIRWEETRHPFFLETALKPLRLGVKITEIPAKWVARDEGDSQNSFFKNFAYFKTEFRIRFMKREDILV